MVFDIFNLKPNKITTDLTSYNFLIYADAGLGKTTFASQLFPKRTIILGAEVGYKGIDGVLAVPVPDYTSLTHYVNQLDTDKAREEYDTIIVDTTTRIGEVIENYILSEFNQKTIGDCKPMGGAYPLINRYYNILFNKLKSRGYNFVYISHAHLENGIYSPKMSDRLSSMICPEVDFIFFLYREGNKRFLITDSTQFNVGKQRIQIPISMELNATVLRNHLVNSIKNGGEFIEEKINNNVMGFQEIKDYKVVIEDIQKILTQFSKNKKKGNMAIELINSTLGVDENGNQRILEHLTQDNIELLEMVLYRLREMDKTNG